LALRAGFVEGRPAALVRDHDALPGRPSYFVLLEWEGGKLLNIRDFRYDRCAVEGAELLVLD
jgi:RNA polymerase sigma-70 factor (ECF subfamily)